MEDERSEYSNERPVAEREEPDFRQEADRPEAEEGYVPPSDDESSEPERGEPPVYSGDPDRDRDPAYREAPSQAEPTQTQSAQGDRRGRGRRGRNRRPSPRERRLQDRNRRRDNRGPYPAGSPRADSDDREGRSESHLSPETRSLLDQAKAELEQVREVLEGVLRDLDHAADLLTKAEHEKDIAEAEIEQLRESLRRLHR